jgi:hypothetical protein
MVLKTVKELVFGIYINHGSQNSFCETSNNWPQPTVLDKIQIPAEHWYGDVVGLSVSR